MNFNMASLHHGFGYTAILIMPPSTITNLYCVNLSVHHNNSTFPINEGSNVDKINKSCLNYNVIANQKLAHERLIAMDPLQHSVQ